ncbi:nitroreductase family protein [Micromonospora sp. M12]
MSQRDELLLTARVPVDLVRTTPDLLALDPAAQDLLFRAARTANTFTDEPVTDAQVAAIHDLIRNGPTAYNGQPLRVLLLRSAAARLGCCRTSRRAIGRRPPARRWWRCSPPTWTSTSGCPSCTRTGRRPGLAQRPSGPRRAGPLQRDPADRLPAGGRTRGGLAAGPMAGFDAAGVNREFFPDGRHETLLLLNVGRPARTPGRSGCPAQHRRGGADAVTPHRLSGAPTRRAAR